MHRKTRSGSDSIPKLNISRPISNQMASVRSSYQYITDLSKIYFNDTSKVTNSDNYITKLPPQVQEDCVMSREFSLRMPQKKVQTSYAVQRKLSYATSLPEYQHKRLVLILLNRNLQKAKIEDLSYCYFHMPIPKQHSSKREAELLLQKISRHLIEQLKLGQTELYFYSKKGEPLRTAFECHPKHETIVVSQTKQFNGISPNVLQVITKLESALPPIKDFELESLEEHISKKYQIKIQNIADFLQNDSSKFNSGEMESLYNKCKVKSQIVKINQEFQHKFNQIRFNHASAGNSISEKYQNLESYLADDNQMTNTQRQVDKEVIITQYDRDLKQLQKDILYNTDSAPKSQLIEGKLINVDQIQVSNKQVDLLQGLLSSKAAKSQDQHFVQMKPKKLKLNKINKKMLIQQLVHQNPLLYKQNIPKLQKKTDLNRKELYQAYIMYKALEATSSQMCDNYKIGDGVNFEAFRNGIYQVFMQPKELALEMFNKIDFNFSGNLNWQEFLDLMVVIKAKTLVERVNLFIKIADKDGNGLLSWNEVYHLTNVCLARFMNSDKQMLASLCEYFTKLIFDTLKITYDEEIPLANIKEAILRGGENSELLSMFCGADM